MQVTLFTKKTFQCVGLVAFVSCGGSPESRRSSTFETSLHSELSPVGLPLGEQSTNEPANGILRSEATRRWLDYRQIDRIAYADRFQFANFRHNAREEYTEARVAPPLDILLVVDDSGSMSEEQANLATKMDPLLSYVQGSDWRIHVVTTDADVKINGVPCSWKATISKGDADFQTKFRTAVVPGTSGSSDEKGIATARRALESPCGGGPWLRTNSALAILIVSDEDDYSSSTDCPGIASCGTPEYLTDYLATIRRINDNVRVYGLIEDSTSTPNSCRTAPTSGANRYFQAIYKTGGICGDVALTDYTAMLRKISEDAASLLPPNIQLGQVPANGQVTVTVNGVALPSTAYRLEDRSLFLLVPIQTGERLEVTYTYDDPFSRDFRLTNPAAADTVRVSSSGTPFAATDFTYDPSTRKISIVPAFAIQPRQVVEVAYRENKPLLTTFFSGPSADPATIQCFLNDGTELHNFTYDPVRQSIVFSVPPTELQLFKCSLVR